jgi:cell division protein FtsQ
MTTVLDTPELDRIDPRFQARRDDVARARHRRRRRWRLTIFGALFVVGGAWLTTRSALLDVDDIEIQGATYTGVDAVHAVSGVAPGDQLIDVDPAAVRDRVRGLPWVADATVARSWRGRLVIGVQEREPVAVLLDTEDRSVLVDRESRVLADATSIDPPIPAEGLVRVEGVVAGQPGEVLPAPADDALAVVSELTPGLRSRVEALTIASDGQIDLRVRPTGRVRFGRASDVSAKLQALQTLFAQVDDEAIATIDVRVPQQSTVTRAT